MTDRTGPSGAGRRLDSRQSAFRLNLEQQKNRAKDLLRAAKAGDEDALKRIGASAAPKLADAQFAIARELRFASWAKLKSHIESMQRQLDAIERREPAPDADLRTLHLRCGHDLQNILVEAGFVGSFHPHITPYCQGPVTAGPERHELMARFIVDGFNGVLGDSRELSYEGVLEGERREDERLLRTADDYERVVIWMEYDNWDQIMLIRLLAHYADAKRPRVLELIVVDEFPGGKRFIGLGELPPEAVRMLWSTRRPVTEAQLDLGREAWRALTSPDPRRLAAIGRSGTPALPIMAPAIRRHVQELPERATGLSASEKMILQIVAGHGSPTLNTIFLELLAREPVFFLGDAGVARVVRDMERAAESPLARTIETPGERLFRNKLTLTDAGRAVLSGARDWHSMKPLPRWVGGVHIVPGVPGWRWDASKGEPVMFGAQTAA
jgi:hypothetical protein